MGNKLLLVAGRHSWHSCAVCTAGRQSALPDRRSSHLSLCRSKPVAFPPRLKMNRTWLASDSGERGAEYDLVSTVTHHGKTIGSGHYTADVRQPCGA